MFGFVQARVASLVHVNLNEKCVCCLRRFIVHYTMGFLRPTWGHYQNNYELPHFCGFSDLAYLVLKRGYLLNSLPQMLAYSPKVNNVQSRCVTEMR